MPIERSDVPAEAVDAVRQAITDRAVKVAFAPSSLSVADSGALSLAMPHRTAYLSLNNIRLNVDLRMVTQTGNWRFLVHEATRANVSVGGVVTETVAHAPIAAASAAMTSSAKYELAELNEGPFVKGFDEAVRAAEGLERVRDGSFEAVFLIVPAVYVAALWLQDRTGIADVLFAIPPSSPPLVSFRPMTTAEFLAILVRLAEKMRRSN